MTRGRKKDLTIPPSRTLVQQRDYRARKAHYIANLEERCQRAEEENIRLRMELDEVKALLTMPALLHPETVEASSELMHNLSVATASLAKFHRLTFANIQSSNERSGIQLSNESPTTQPEYRQASDTAHDAIAIRRKPTYREDSSTRLLQPSHRLSSPVFPRLSPDIDSECCGGLLDCEHLIDRDSGSDNHLTDEDPGSKCCGGLLDCQDLLDKVHGSDNYVTDEDLGLKTTSRLSGLRSTSDKRLG